MHAVGHRSRQLSAFAPLVAAAETVVLVLALVVALGPGLPTGTPGGGPVPSPTPVVTPSPTQTPASPSPTPSPRPTPSPTPVVTPSPTAPPASPSPTPVPTVRPTPTPASSGPPNCRYDDILTPHRSYADWRITLLDTIYRLPADYYPADLVDTAAAGANGGYLVRRLLVDDLRALVAAARANGTPVEIRSAFRSYEQQKRTFEYWVKVGGYEQALRTSARPGHSEHQLGTTVDFTSLGGRAPWEYADWASTPAGGWMSKNAWKYGFVMSYPKGRSAMTCYDYEPWHYRYVGRELAAAISASGLSPREFLWQLQ